ncbi:MAG: RagB/SusD family nutrient uptake outer membrane protein [Sphingobacterium composti]
MRVINKYILRKSVLLMLPLALSLGACDKDFLNLPPELSLPEENSYDTKSRIEAQVRGLYGSLKDGTFYAGRYQIYNDIRGEDFLNRTGNGVTGYSTYQFTNDASDSYITNFWIQGYLTINRVNKFIADFETAPAGVVTDAEKAAFLGEAKFVRALAYYSLVQLFAKPYALNNGESRGIPLRLNPETSTANNDLAPSPVKDIYTQILKDLNEAEGALPVTISSADVRTTRAHKNTAIALKTRIYLAMGNYSQVITEANKIVSATAPFKATSGVAHQLDESIANVFSSYNTLENVFSWPYASTNAPGTQNQLGYYYNVGNIEYYLNPNGIFGNTAWPASDARKSEFVTLYPGSSWNILTKWGGTPYLDWVPVIRYSEVLLNLAEAEAEVGSQTRSLALLSAVRHRADSDYVFPTFANKQSLIDAILLERRIELLGEGFRAADAQRRLLPLPAVGAGTPIPVTDDRYTFPIPTNERLTNTETN